MDYISVSHVIICQNNNYIFQYFSDVLLNFFNLPSTLTIKVRCLIFYNEPLKVGKVGTSLSQLLGQHYRG